MRIHTVCCCTINIQLQQKETGTNLSILNGARVTFTVMERTTEFKGTSTDI